MSGKLLEEDFTDGELAPGAGAVPESLAARLRSYRPQLQLVALGSPGERRVLRFHVKRLQKVRTIVGVLSAAAVQVL